MKKLASGIKNENGLKVFIITNSQVKETINFLRKEYPKDFNRYLKFVLKVVYKLDITEVERLEIIEEAIQTFAYAKLINPKIDPFLLAEVVIQNHNFEMIKEFVEKYSSDEYYEKALRKNENNQETTSFLLKELIGNKNEILRLTTNLPIPRHKGSRNKCQFKTISSIRIPQTLYKILSELQDFNVSTYVSLLLMKHKVAEIDPKEVLEFNLKLHEQYPHFFGKMQNKTFILFLPAYFHYLAYNQKAQPRRHKNEYRKFINLTGLLYYLLLKKEYPTVL